MKAISIWQPWASLIADGHKRFETRSWATQYRGPLLICSGLRIPRLHELDDRVRALVNGNCLPLGMAVCVVDLEFCWPVTDPFVMGLTPHDSIEFALGDYSPGRFAWNLQNVRRFKEPWPVRGRQGLFDVPGPEIARHELEVE